MCIKSVVKDKAGNEGELTLNVMMVTVSKASCIPNNITWNDTKVRLIIYNNII